MIIAKFNITSTFKKGVIYAKAGDEVILIAMMGTVGIYETVRNKVRFSISDFSLLTEIETINVQEKKVKEEPQKRSPVIFSTPLSAPVIPKPKPVKNDSQLSLF